MAIYTHIVRSQCYDYPKGDFPKDSFADLYNEAYKKKLTKTNLRKNELYLTIIFQPIFSFSDTFIERLFYTLGLSKMNFKKEIERKRQALRNEEEKLNEIVDMAKTSLKHYQPEILSTYEENGNMYSQVLEFLSFLINGGKQKVLLPKMSISKMLASSRVFFGKESLEIHLPSGYTRVGAFLGFKEYPSVTSVNMLDELLEADYDFILTESFLPKNRQVALNALKLAQTRMIQGGEVAQSLIDELDTALDDVSAGRLVMGEHHINLLVLARNAQALKQNISSARASFANLGVIVAREDLAIESAYWAMLPCNYKYRPRPALVNSKNFASFSPFHNFPIGRIDYNQWGNALTMFETSSHSPFYFSHHKAVENKKGAGFARTLGNTLITGPSGSGKTVIQAHLIAQAIKFDPTIVVFDKDRGLDPFVRAIGGNYSTLKKGEKTGFNPFQLPKNEKNIAFLNDLIKKIISINGYIIPVQEEENIYNAINSLYELPQSSRNMSNLLSYFNSTSLDGIFARLKKWCNHVSGEESGALAWVFDNEVDVLDLEKYKIFGFDCTDFLDNEEVRTPLIMYLFHRMDELIDGRRFLCYLDEFWKMLQDSYFEDFAQNKLKTIRKQNGLLVFGTQSMKDVLSSKISHSILEQVPKMIHFGNEKANEEDFLIGAKLSNKEYGLIKNELPNTRKALLKDENESIVIKLDLKGFDKFLYVMSGTSESVKKCEEIRSQYGEDPKDWLEPFMQTNI